MTYKAEIEFGFEAYILFPGNKIGFAELAGSVQRKYKCNEAFTL